MLSSSRQSWSFGPYGSWAAQECRNRRNGASFAFARFACQSAIAASGQSISPPAELNDDLKGKLDDLTKADAKDFDSKYLADQVDGHQKALDLMQRYANDGDVPQIKDFATATAPAVQMHLDKAKGLKDANKEMKKDDTAPPATPPAK